MHPRPSALSVLPEDTRESLESLRADAILLTIQSLLALALLVNLIVIFWKDAPPMLWLVVPSLVLTASLAYVLLRRRAWLAVAGLVGGLIISIDVAIHVLPGSGLACLLSVAVIFAGAFQGWRASVFVAAVVNVMVVLLTWYSESIIPIEVAAITIILAWVNVLASWLVSRPLQVALDWWLHSYTQALEALDETRERQGELGRLSKSLNETCEKLEQMNRELEHARKAADEARRRKDQFAAAASHELRTPLNLITGFSEMIIDSSQSGYGEPLPKGYVDDVEAIYRNACHISTLIDDILDLSQIDTKRMALQRQQVDLAQIIEQTIMSMRAQFENRGIDLSVDVPGDIPPLAADPTRIRQILINLLINALRFTDEGGVTISAEHVVKDRQVVVTVKDTGVGIATEDLADIFEEFHQGGDPRHRRGGSGLGLAVTKQFVEMHGGSIWVASELGNGSAFCFSLPLTEQVIASSYASLPVATRALLTGDDSRRMVMVLAEDDTTGRILERYLDGYSVVRARNLQQALEIAEVRGLHAVVTTAPKLAEDLRSHLDAERRSRLPIVTCALHATRSVVEKHRSVSDLLQKPITTTRLQEALGLLALNGRGRKVSDVVIVDDEPEMLRLLTRMVRSWSRRCRIRTARDGAECLQLLRERPPDVVLLDLLMPGMDGYAVLDQMQAEDALAEVPVLLVTASDSRDGAILARDVVITRPGGLSVGEAIACLKSSLDSLASYDLPVAS